MPKVWIDEDQNQIRLTDVPGDRRVMLELTSANGRHGVTHLTADDAFNVGVALIAAARRVGRGAAGGEE